MGPEGQLLTFHPQLLAGSAFLRKDSHSGSDHVNLPEEILHGFSNLREGFTARIWQGGLYVLSNKYFTWIHLGEMYEMRAST